MKQGIRIVCAGAIFIAVLSSGPAWGALCGPDTFGYRWRDHNSGATADNTNFSNPGAHPSPSADPGTPVRVPLGFDFLYYGVTYNEVFISGYGWVSFLDPGQNYWGAGCGPSANTPQATIEVFRSSSDRLTPQSARYETVSADTFKVEWAGVMSDGTSTYVATLFIYRTGVIRMQYDYIGDAMRLWYVAIGIENETGTDGLQAKCMMTNFCGFDPDSLDGTVLEFYAIPDLNCDPAGQIACGGIETLRRGQTATPNAQNYACSPKTYLGDERILAFTITEASTVTVDLIGVGGNDLDVILLGSCNEMDCIAWSEDNLLVRILPPGTYFIVVDGPTPSDTDNDVDVALGCTAVSTPISCGDSEAGSTIGRQNLLDNLTCAAPKPLDGPDQIYELTVAAATNVEATITAGVDLDVLFLNSLLPANCVEWGNDRLKAWNIQPGTYWVVADGNAGREGAFDLTIDCRIDLDCQPPEGTIACGQRVFGDTRTGQNNVNEYPCMAGVDFSGNELVYRFSNPVDQDVTFRLLNAELGLEVFLLESCNEGACISGGPYPICEPGQPAGDYFLVVDGVDGANGTFDLEVRCNEPIDPPPVPFSHWRTCEGSGGPSQGGMRWDFNSGLYCGTGCDFALYVVVDCGTQFHIPTWDVESAHLGIYSLIDGSYVDMTALNDVGTFSPATHNPMGDNQTINDAATDVSMGDVRIDWMDSGCPSETGQDPLFNNHAVDINFFGAPTVCGVYRMEFYNWGGFVWELYANCDGSRQVQHRIYESECEALNTFNPAAELNFPSPPTFTGVCPDITVHVEVQNVGCVPTAISPFTLLINGGADGTIDSDAGQLQPGQSTIVPVPLAGVPNNAVITVIADREAIPGDHGRLEECFEWGGGIASCGTPGGSREFDFPACSVCDVQANGPATLCEDEQGQFFASNSQGTAPFTWGWDMDGDTFADGTGSPFFWTYSTPGLQTVTLYMSDNTGCQAIDQIQVNVLPDPIPPAVSETLMLAKESGTDIRFTWSDLPPADITEYEVVVHEYAPGNPPDQLAMDNGFVVATAPSGNPGVAEPNGLRLPPWLRYYKVRATSPCTGNLHGPTKN